MSVKEMSFDTLASLDHCRICLESPKQFKSLADIFTEGTIIFDVINQITGLKVNITDDFPQQICFKCLDELKVCVEFKEKAVTSDQILKSNGAQIKEEFNDDDFESFDDMVGSTIEVNIEDALKTVRNSSSSLIKKKKSSKGKFPILRCCICGEDFETDKALLEHAAKDHPFGAPQERQVTSLHVFECKLCKRKYWKKKHLADHYKDVNYIEPKRLNATPYNEKKRVMCSDCGKLFPCKIDLEVHYANVHSTTRDIECEQCGKRFSHEKCLARHKFRVHSDIFYTCDTCRKQFRDKNLLKSHIVVHIEEKRFKCPRCPKSFSLKYAFDNHMVVEHSEVKRPHSCDKCDKTYRWLSDLKKHIRAEHLGMPPCSCFYCGRGFTSSSSKNYHQKRCQLNPVPFSGPTTLNKIITPTAFNLL